MLIYNSAVGNILNNNMIKSNKSKVNAAGSQKYTRWNIFCTDCRRRSCFHYFSTSSKNKATCGSSCNWNSLYDGSRLVLDGKGKVIDSFGGDMIQINGITSILFDNASRGYSTDFTFTGSKNLYSGISIISEENDTLNFNFDGHAETITFNVGSYDKDELLNEIQGKLDSKNIDIIASYNYSGELVFKSNIPGNITLNNFSGNAYVPIFEQPYFTPISSISASASSFRGQKDLSSGIEITDSNNTLEYTVDGGTTQMLTIDDGTYSSVDDIVSELNSKLSPDSGIVAVRDGNRIDFNRTEYGPSYSVKFTGVSAYD